MRGDRGQGSAGGVANKNNKVIRGVMRVRGLGLGVMRVCIIKAKYKI